MLKLEQIQIQIRYRSGTNFLSFSWSD